MLGIYIVEIRINMRQMAVYSCCGSIQLLKSGINSQSCPIFLWPHGSVLRLLWLLKLKQSAGGLWSTSGDLSDPRVQHSVSLILGDRAS